VNKINPFQACNYAKTIENEHFQKQQIASDAEYSTEVKDDSSRALEPVFSIQARKQVSRFGGAQYIFRGTRFLPLLDVQNQFSWAQQNLGRHKRNLGGTAPNALPWLRACSH